ncbi:MAG: hypothetical protein K2N73_11715 [Lachnospiraceae bacterium]|nr:hypothetical protein [Lachnospiraceae bacterium]
MDNRKNGANRLGIDRELAGKMKAKKIRNENARPVQPMNMQNITMYLSGKNIVILHGFPL